MTNLPGSCLLASLARKNVTAGVNVPADSHVLPCGERMGSFEARVHAPKGRSVAGAAKASEAARSNGTMRILGFRTCMFSDSSLRWLRILGWLELHRADDAFAFFHDYQLVGLDVLQRLHKAAGPANLQQLHLLCFADAEMDAQIILRKIASAAAHFVDLRMKGFFARQMRDAFDARADAAAIRFRSDGFDFDPIVSGAGIA